MKSDLVTQDLWNMVESTTKPPNQEDDEDAITNWSKRNFKALQLIWNSCGSKAFSKICLTDSAHIAWNTLLKAYGTPNNNSGGKFSLSFSISTMHVFNNFACLMQLTKVRMTLLTSLKIIMWIGVNE